MELRNGVLCYIVAFNMAKRGICPFEECETYYDNCEKCVGKFFEGKDKDKFILAQ